MLIAAAFFVVEDIHLIGIPYWWKGDTPTLVATIQKQCPDLFPFVSPVHRNANASLPEPISEFDVPSALRKGIQPAASREGKCIISSL